MYPRTLLVVLSAGFPHESLTLWEASGVSLLSLFGLFSRFVFSCFPELFFWRLCSDKGGQSCKKGSQNGAESAPKETSRHVPEAWYLLYGKHIGPSRERSETGCFSEPVPRDSRELSRGSFLRFFDGFGISLGSVLRPWSLQFSVLFLDAFLRRPLTS